MFILRMAWRETRTSWGRLLFFFGCVALGVAAIVVLRSVMQQVRTTLTGEARSLVGADLVLQSTRAWTPELRARIEGILAGSLAQGPTDVIETQTMASAAEGQGTGIVRLVELRGSGPGFPFYGALELEHGAYRHDLLRDRGVLVQPELLVELGLAVGDSLRLAGQSFEIRGVVTRDRVQRGGFALGPRVYVDVEDLRATSLLGFGSRASYQLHVKVADDELDRLTRRLRRSLRREVAIVRTWRSLEDRLGRNLTVSENYLSLVGFAIVVLGGIGVWSVTRVIVQQKLRSVAILKCLGAASRRVLAIYVLQALWLAAGGCLIGVAVGAFALRMIPPHLLEPMGITHVSLTLSAVLQAVGVGLLVSLLFALAPLLEVRRVKPLLLLRADTAQTARKRDWESWLAWVVIGIALVLVAVWQADSLRAGAYVSAGLGVVSILLALASRLLVRLAAPLTRSSRFALRHAVISLGRPGNQTRVILMAVGLGCFFILAVRAVQGNLLHELTEQIGGNSPDLILIDIQRDQRDGVAAAIAPYVRRPPRLMPLLRARVVGLEGQRVRLASAEDVRRQGRMTREFGMTHRAELQDNERVTAGEFWDGPLTQPQVAEGIDTEVSIEQDIHDEASVSVGDVMRFDVAGRPLTARVTSVRRVAWDDTQNGGFVFVLRPGPAVERVGYNYVGFVEAHDTPQARGELQRTLVRSFPNVSVIDVRSLIASIRDVVDNVTLGVTIVGAVLLGGGVLILIGAIAMTRFQRLYEAAIYRTLGASTRTLATMTAIEYGVLGTLAGVLGAVGAAGLSWVLARFLFDIDWRPAPGLMAIGVVLTAATVSVVGLAASVDVLRQKPLRTLRSE
jgi:putative ABC transport system permease protein